MSKKMFAFIAEGDVFAKWIIENPQSSEMLVAGLQSNPIIMELPEDSPVDQGWTFDGKDFYPPAD